MNPPDDTSTNVDDTELENLPEGDTDTETPSGDTDKDTPEDRYAPLLTELGIDKTYKDPEAALRSLPEKERSVTQLQQENARMRDLLQTLSRQPDKRDEPKALSGDDFVERFNADPLAALKDAGLVFRDDLRPIEQNIQNTSALASRQRFIDTLDGLPGLETVADYMRQTGQVPPTGTNPVWDAMNQMYQSNPGLQGADEAAILPLLHRAVSGNTSGDGRRTVSPTTTRRKASATTASGGPGAPETEPDFTKMTVEQMEAYWRKKGQLPDDM